MDKKQELIDSLKEVATSLEKRNIFPIVINSVILALQSSRIVPDDSVVLELYEAHHIVEHTAQDGGCGICISIYESLTSQLAAIEAAKGESNGKT